MNKNEVTFTNLQLRSQSDGDGRTISGIAVPFGKVISTWEGAETFDADCVFNGLDETKLYYQHDQIIGKITDSKQLEDGLHITARIADTALGRDVTALLRDGALDSLSVGFIPQLTEYDDAGIAHRKKVDLLEVSVVSFPAYRDAKINQQRSQQTSQEQKEKTVNIEELENRMNEFEENQRTLKTQLANMPAHEEPTVLGSQYRNSGEYLQALARGDSDAVALMKQTRDAITSTSSGNLSTWIADDIKLIEQRRKVSNLITHAALPERGFTMEYNVLKTDTTKVTAHTEAEALAFGKIEFGTKSVDIKTYGGYTTLTREVIERATTPMLNTALAALRNAYAKATETAVRDYLYSTIKTQREANNKIDAQAASSLTITDWVDIIINASELADDRNVRLQRLLVSKDVLRSLISLKDTGSRFFDLTGAGVDNIGTFDLTGVAGSFLRVPVQLLPNAEEGTACFIDSEAVTMWESGGPTQLSATDPTKIVDTYSVYGYMAVASTNTDGLIPVKFAA